MNTASEAIHKFVVYVINPIMLVLFAAGFFLFMLGAVELMLKLSKGESDTTAGKRHMIWGIIGMFIMVSVAGIITFITSTFGINITGNAVDTSNLNAGTSQIFFR
jgi:hypothetical protein